MNAQLWIIYFPDELASSSELALLADNKACSDRSGHQFRSGVADRLPRSALLRTISLNQNFGCED